MQEDRISFIHALRAVACLLVVYAHWIGFRAPPDWFIKPYVEGYFVQPLGLIWHMGYLGVALFFLVSGYIITHVAQRETRGAFALKRVFRIYPPMIAAALMAWALVTWGPVKWTSITPSEFPFEASIVASKYKLVSPSYTLVMELAFYAIAVAILPMMQTRPALATLLVTAIPFLIFMAGPFASETVNQIIGYSIFVAVFPVGMAIYYYHAGRISVWTALALICVAVTAFGYMQSMFTLDTVVAIVIFGIVATAGRELTVSPLLSSVALVSYSLYLLHAPIGKTVFGLGLNYTLALVIAIATVAAASAICYISIERPANRFARWILVRRRSVPAFADK